MAAGIGGVVGGAASVLGYAAVTLASGDEWDWGQAGVAAGTGFAAGAICMATLLIACGAASAAASALQYGLGPGEKSVEGYAIAAGLGAVVAPLVHAPYVSVISELYPWGGALRWTARDVAEEFASAFSVRRFSGSFWRSALASGVTSGGTRVVGASSK